MGRGSPDPSGRIATLRADAVAGLTVAVMGVPAAMAHALIVGLPPVYGLYTAIVSCLVAAALGSSRHLVTGPTNALSMVLLSLVADRESLAEIGVLEAVFFITFLVGLVQIVFGLLRLGGIVRYVSNSVVIGFTAGAGVLIAANQIKNLLGLDLDGARRFHEILATAVSRVGDTNLHSLAIGVLTAAMVVVVPRFDRRLPGPLVGVLVGGLACYLLGWGDEARGAAKVALLMDIEPIPSGLPTFHFPELLAAPSYDRLAEFGPGAVALAILGLVEAASIARAVAASSGQRLNFSREFTGQGASNLVGSFFSCFVASGSFTRTAVSYKSGAQTRMAAVFSAVWTTLAVLFLAPVANFTPTPALAGILMVIAYTMIDKHRFALTWRSGASPRIVLIGTLAATLVLPLEFAIFVGVFLSIIALLHSTGRIRLSQLVPRRHGGFDEVPFNRAAPAEVVTINMEGPLYFAAADELDYELLRCVTPQTRVVVLRMRRLRTAGSTAMAMLSHFSSLLHGRRIHLVVCGIQKEMETLLTESGVRRQLGDQNLFFADVGLLQSTELALARARSIAEAERRMGPNASTEVRRSSPDRLRAADLMNTRCIRFGDQHQLREAVWLMSGLQAQSKSLSADPLFLQDREAKLGGELSPWRLLEALCEKTGVEGGEPPNDERYAQLLRRDFTRPITRLARSVEGVSADANLATLMQQAVEDDLQVIPVCDEDGRLEGLVSADDLLRGLRQQLQRGAEEEPSDD